MFGHAVLLSKGDKVSAVNPNGLPKEALRNEAVAAWKSSAVHQSA